MTETFGAAYAELYDLMYGGKDYEHECDVIQHFVGAEQPRRVLDVGCGTGSHALALARRGFHVVGVDRSPAMIDAARRKAGAAGVQADFVVGDATDAVVAGPFDAVTIMFAVLGYMTETPQVRACLANARSHLEPGGKLLFDVWHGAAVLTQRPLERTRVFDHSGGFIVRASTPVLQADRNVVDVMTRIWQVSGTRLVLDIEEVHSVRYFFVPELRTLLEEASFGAPHFFAFPDPHEPPTEHSWNLGCVVEAVA